LGEAGAGQSARTRGRGAMQWFGCPLKPPAAAIEKKLARAAVSPAVGDLECWIVV